MNELVGAAAVAVVAWFAAGTIYNVRAGRALMRWMQDGLQQLGSRATVRWLGSTAVEMVVRESRPPFVSATLVIFLEARDLPWMWAIGRGSGRRDILIVRGMLGTLPATELEALRRASWSGRDARGRVPSDWLVRETASGLAVHAPGHDALARADELLGMVSRAGFEVHRLSVRRTEPHFQLHVALPRRSQSAQGFFEAVRSAAARSLV